MSSAYKVLTDEEYTKLKIEKRLFLISFFKVFNTNLNKIPIIFKEKLADNLNLSLKEYSNNLINKYSIKTDVIQEYEFEDNWVIENKFINSNYNTKINIALLSKEIIDTKNKPWVIIVHGLNSNKHKSFFYSIEYLKRKYNVAIFDLRNHGLSTKNKTTMGFNEKFDLDAVVKYIQKNYEPKSISLHGWSMGTFTIMEYLKKININYKNKFEFIILDSPIDRLINLFKYYLKTKYDLNYFDNFDLINKYCIEKYNYSIEDINPGYDLSIVKEYKILFILCKNDLVTPYNLGEKAYENKIYFEKIQKSKKIVLDCKHASGIYNFYNKYWKNIFQFIKGEQN